MKKSLLYLLPLLLASASCNRDLSPYNFGSSSFQPPAAANPCAVPPDPGHVWSDLETNPGSQVYGDTSPVPSWATGIAYTGCHSVKIPMNPRSWAYWYGYWISPQPSVQPGLTRFQLSYLVNQSFSATLYLDEGTSTGNGETWSTTVNFIASPSWQILTIPQTSFSGGTSFDTQDIADFWFFNSAPTIITTTLYIDDIKFLP